MKRETPPPGPPDPASEPGGNKTPRANYRRPSLTRLGAVNEITSGAGSPVTDTASLPAESDQNP